MFQVIDFASRHLRTPEETISAVVGLLLAGIISSRVARYLQSRKEMHRRLELRRHVNQVERKWF